MYKRIISRKVDAKIENSGVIKLPIKGFCEEFPERV